MKVLLLAGSIMAATPLAAQSSPTPQDSAAIRAVVEDSVHRAFVRQIVADTAWVQVADLRRMIDVPSHGKGTDSGTALLTSEVRVERRRGRWVVTAERMYDTPQSDTVTVRVLFDGPGRAKVDTIRSKPKP